MSLTDITAEQVDTTSVSAIATFGPDVEISRDPASLEVLDIDSSDLVDPVQIVEDKLAVKLAVGHVAEPQTVGDGVVRAPGGEEDR